VSPVLDELISELAKAREDGADASETLSRMEVVAAQPGGLERLVQRFARSSDPVLTRAVTFLLARAASRESPPTAAVWSAVDALTADDDWTRVNLLSALQLLAARDALGSAQPSRGLVPFLADALGRGPQVVDAAAPAMLSLAAAGTLDRVDRASLIAALDRLEPLQDEDIQTDIDVLRVRLGS
jgi:hypothetical protein